MDKKSRTDPLEAPKVGQTGTHPVDINLNAFLQLGGGSQHCFSHLFPTLCPSPAAVPGLQLQRIRASMEHMAAEPSAVLSTLQSQKGGILPFVLEHLFADCLSVIQMDERMQSHISMSLLIPNSHTSPWETLAMVYGRLQLCFLKAGL